MKSKVTFRAKRITAIAAAAMLAASVLCGCGGSNNGKTSATAGTAANSIGDSHPDQYKNYIASFSSEVTPFIETELPKLLNAVASLNPSNYASWKAEFEEDFDKCEHWYNELSSAEMFCPSEITEQHRAMVTTVATFYKILDGMKPRIEAADSGDFSQLTSMSAEYAQAAEISKNMWTRALDDVNAAIK